MNITPRSLDYYYSKEAPFKEYLAQQYLKSNIDIVIEKRLREAIGSIEEISQIAVDTLSSHISDVAVAVDNTNDNLEVISVQLSDIGYDLREINSTLISGFNLLGEKLDSLNIWLSRIALDSQELLKVAKTPIQTWALNQYEIACDAAKRSLFQESLEAVTLAIDGTDFQSGYKLDHRFHFLRGMLLSGMSGDPECASLIDLSGARDAFLTSARYARASYIDAYTEAMLNAGRLAYGLGLRTEARSHYRDVLSVAKKSREATYQLARLAAHAGETIEAKALLRRVVAWDWRSAIRAAADREFLPCIDIVHDVVLEAAHRYADEVAVDAENAAALLNRIYATFPEEYLLKQQSSLSKLSAEIKTVQEVAARSQLIECARSTGRAKNLSKTLDKLIGYILAHVRSVENKRITRNEHDSNYIGIPKRPGILILSPVVRPWYDQGANPVLITSGTVIIITGLLAFWAYADAGTDNVFWRAILSILAGAVGLVIAVLVAQGVQPFLKHLADLDISMQHAANQRKQDAHVAETTFWHVTVKERQAANDIFIRQKEADIKAVIAEFERRVRS